MVAVGVGEDEECDGDRVVHEHDLEVFAFRVHEQRGVDRVKVEAALGKVDELHVLGYVGVKLPACKTIINFLIYLLKVIFNI